MAPLARSTTSKTTTSIVSRLAAAEISAAPDTVESGRGAAPGGDALDGEKHEADAKPDIEHVFVKDDPRPTSQHLSNTAQPPSSASSLCRSNCRSIALFSKHILANVTFPAL